MEKETYLSVFTLFKAVIYMTFVFGFLLLGIYKYGDVGILYVGIIFSAVFSTLAFLRLDDYGGKYGRE